MKSIIEFILSLFKPNGLQLGSNSPLDRELPLHKDLPSGIVVPSEAMKPYLEENEKDKENKDKRKVFKPIEHKSDRTVTELQELKAENLPLASLIEDLNIFTNREFDKNIVITMIKRTQEEQDYLYKDDEGYKKKKFNSPHQFMQAIDIRSRTFTADEIFQIEAYLNEKWNDSNDSRYYKWTAKNHNVSHGIHFHIQYLKR